MTQGSGYRRTPCQWIHYADYEMDPLRRSRRGSITPVTNWILYADHGMDPIWRSVTVPLIPLAAAALLECKPQGTYALSCDLDTPRKNGQPRKNGGGDRHLAATTMSNWAAAAAKTIPGFATKRIRSGVETLLASARISTEIRGRLQSHGITGVQARHYDGHDYMDEKRHALKTLATLLNAPNKSSNVRQFKAA